MKHYDKIVFILGLIACLAGVGVYLGVKPEAKSERMLAPKGEEFAEWKDDRTFSTAPVKWESPTLDMETGWNYDLFSTPETTWLSGEKRYIAKELPVPPEEPFGLTLLSMENPLSRLRVATCSSDVPPRRVKNAEGKGSSFQTFVKFEDSKGGEVTVDFRKIAGVKMSKEEVDGRTIISLTPRRPAEIPGQNVALKDFKIVRGESDSGDGTFYTKYMATFVDHDDKDKEFRALEEFVRDSSRVEAVFRDEFSSREWRYREAFMPGAEKPEVEIMTRESSSDPWTFLGKEPAFQAGGATYFVKIVDISAQQATITKQSESNGKSKRPKVRQVVLDLAR